MKLANICFTGENATNNWLVTKVKEGNVFLGSVVTVGVAQEALLVEGGICSNIYGRGSHVVRTINIPVIASAVRKYFDKDTPFFVEVLFVNIREFIGVKWGIDNPVCIMENRFHNKVNLQIHGRYNFKVCNSRLFLNKVVGTMKLNEVYYYDFVSEMLKGYLNHILPTVLSEFISERQINVYDFGVYYEELSRRIFGIISNIFDDYGLELKDFYIEGISVLKQEESKTFVYRCPNCGSTLKNLDFICPYCQSKIFLSRLNEANRTSTRNLSKYIRELQNVKELFGDTIDAQDALLSMSICLMARASYDEAENYLKKLISRIPNDGECYYYLALCKMKKQRPYMHTLSEIRKICEEVKTAIDIRPQGKYYYILHLIQLDYYNKKALKEGDNAEKLKEKAYFYGMDEEAIDEVKTYCGFKS